MNTETPTDEATKGPPVAKAKSNAKADNRLAKALLDVPDNELTCRGVLHAWGLERDFHLYTVKDTSVRHLRRIWKCMRDCEVRAVEIFIVTRNGKIERLDRDLKYPKGYQLHGIPKGANRLRVVQNEMYRRAIRDAAGALPGESDAPEA